MANPIVKGAAGIAYAATADDEDDLYVDDSTRKPKRKRTLSEIQLDKLMLGE